VDLEMGLLVLLSCVTDCDILSVRLSVMK
jgi:hypothetical protein